MIAQAAQRNHRVEHGWKDGGQTIVAVADPLDHPAFGDSKSIAPERTDLVVFTELQDAINEDEKLFETLRVQTRGFLGFDVKLFDALFFWKPMSDFVMIDDGQRDHH